MSELEVLTESQELNRLLLRNARQPVAVIAQVTGIPEGEVAERLEKLLNRPDWRTDLMDEKLLLAEVGLLVDDIRARMSRTRVEDEGWASMARVQLQAIKTMLEQLDKRRKAVDSELEKVSHAQARLFAEAIKLAKERAIFNLEKQFPEVPVEVLHQEFDSSLQDAVMFLETRTHE